jgi:hypothetical protein
MDYPQVRVRLLEAFAPGKRDTQVHTGVEAAQIED